MTSSPESSSPLAPPLVRRGLPPGLVRRAVAPACEGDVDSPPPPPPRSRDTDFRTRRAGGAGGGARPGAKERNMTVMSGVTGCERANNVWIFIRSCSRQKTAVEIHEGGGPTGMGLRREQALAQNSGRSSRRKENRHQSAHTAAGGHDARHPTIRGHREPPVRRTSSEICRTSIRTSRLRRTRAARRGTQRGQQHRQEKSRRPYAWHRRNRYTYYSPVFLSQFRLAVMNSGECRHGLRVRRTKLIHDSQAVRAPSHRRV